VEEEYLSVREILLTRVHACRFELLSMISDHAAFGPNARQINGITQSGHPCVRAVSAVQWFGPLLCRARRLARATMVLIWQVVPEKTPWAYVWQENNCRAG
jgi:hypothetical protein